ncbi:MAG: NAD(P)H-hydrate dehydratase [Candidatus Aenigmarchaeota archaeon]|nr:NAD(P)H-hydrate dehydratase [Candidatus Aenigmarchaeota archaeon]
MKVCSRKEIGELDKLAMEEHGIPEEILMENAGEAAYYVILKEFGVKDKKFVVICGGGNNGGDGFVVARKLYSTGGDVDVFLLAEREKYRGSARKNLEILPKSMRIHYVDSYENLKSIHQAFLGLKDTLSKADAVVDAIFGTGLTRNVEGIYKEVIELINESKKKVFAIDIPSGINSDTGQEMGISVKANYTITYGLPKRGELLYPGYGRCGKLYVSHISYPPELQNSDSIKVEVFKPVPLPERRADTTKWDYGPVLFIAGSSSYYWAPIASASSCLKAGGGYSYLACPESLAPSLAEAGREVVFLPQKEVIPGFLTLENKDDLLRIYKERRARMVVMGPGLSTHEGTQQLVRELAREIDVPLLIDGDGITAIAQDTKIIEERKAPTILTPHTGEMGRITKIDRIEIEKNRIDYLQKATQELNAIIVLKGPHTLIGYPDQKVYISLSGDTGGKAGMATAGSGDVLNGTIAAMYVQGLTLEDAVPTGVFIHGLTGDLVAKEKGPRGMTAKDILDYLPRAVKYYEDNFEEISKNLYDKIHVI